MYQATHGELEVSSAYREQWSFKSSFGKTYCLDTRVNKDEQLDYQILVMHDKQSLDIMTMPPTLEDLITAW